MTPEEIKEDDRIADKQLEQNSRPYFEQTVILGLTPQEAQILADVLDIATKAGGIQVAKATVRLMDILMQAVEQQKNG